MHILINEMLNGTYESESTESSEEMFDYIYHKKGYCYNEDCIKSKHKSTVYRCNSCQLFTCSFCIRSSVTYRQILCPRCLKQNDEQLYNHYFRQINN